MAAAACHPRARWSALDATGATTICATRATALRSTTPRNHHMVLLGIVTALQAHAAQRQAYRSPLMILSHDPTTTTRYLRSPRPSVVGCRRRRIYRRGQARRTPGTRSMAFEPLRLEHRLDSVGCRDQADTVVGPHARSQRHLHAGIWSRDRPAVAPPVPSAFGRSTPC